MVRNKKKIWLAIKRKKNEEKNAGTNIIKIYNMVMDASTTQSIGDAINIFMWFCIYGSLGTIFYVAARATHKLITK